MGGKSEGLSRTLERLYTRCFSCRLLESFELEGSWRQNTSVAKAAEEKAALIEIYQSAPKKYRVKTLLEKPSGYLIRFAILGFDIVSQVRSGENGGKRLEHNFLILDWKTQKLNEKGEAHFDFSQFDFKKYKKLAGNKLADKKLAIVAWLEKSPSLKPLQVAGGYLQ